ncbi:MAG TPA: trehalose-6-phosphate synthase, partial [Actinoplanes sp.]|nr:trehalose-6-phosphate synthase [Actinoplanes sp.]
VKDALMRAVAAEPADARRRIRVMQRHLRAHDVADWARTFLTDLEAPATGELDAADELDAAETDDRR